MRYKIFYIVLFVFWSVPSQGVMSFDCYGAFAPFQKESKESLSRVLNPEVQGLELKPCGSNCLQLSSRTSLGFYLEMDESLSEPKSIISEGSKVLKIPSLDFLKSHSSEDALRNWLTGHEKHPYSESSEKFLYRPIQLEAIRAYEKAVELGARSFLHVAPTATGKTSVLISSLLKRLTSPGAKKIVIVTAHQIHLIEQLSKALVMGIKEKKFGIFPEIDLVNWNKEKRRDLSSRILSALSKEGPTIFIMTSQSLKKQLASLEPSSYEKLSFHLEGVFIDEAHHLGADKTRTAITELLEKSSAFLYGSTATPVHHELSLSGLFERIHWSYLNTGPGFLKIISRALF